MENDSVQVKNMVIEENLYYNKENLLSYRIEYPQFFSPKYQNSLNKINLYYKNKSYELQRTCIKRLFLEAIDEYNYSISRGYPVRKFEVILTYNITFNQDCTISLYFDQYDYMGGAHGMTIRSSDTWNIEDADKLVLCDLFNDAIDCQIYLTNVINNQIKLKQEFDGNYMYFDSAGKNVENNLNYNNFYLTTNPNGIVIYYQLYDIAPYSMGMPEFIIPYDPYAMIRPKCS